MNRLNRFPFLPDTLESRGYNVFPDCLENDSTVFFHATTIGKLRRILKQGLRPGVEIGGNLLTISYGETSMEALTHWINIRKPDENGVILALKFGSLEELKRDDGVWRTRALVSQPRVVGVCMIPCSYVHR